MFNPLNYPIIFTQPLRMASSWVEHSPFAMLLIEILKPKVLVELGTYSGTSYCTFCQAVKNLELDTRCFAIDTWEGDPHQGLYNNEVLEDLRKHHDPLYGSFSQLIQSTFDEAALQFENTSIDLLHIDGFHTYKAVKNDFETWLPKMSDSGIIIFHDIDYRVQDFGVWRLWEELTNKYPSFEFRHCAGLGILAVGIKPPEVLFELFNSTPLEIRAIRELFFQLGNRYQLKNSNDAITQGKKWLEEQWKNWKEVAESRSVYITQLEEASREKDRRLNLLENQLISKEEILSQNRIILEEQTIWAKNLDSRLKTLNKSLLYRTLQRLKLLPF